LTVLGKIGACGHWIDEIRKLLWKITPSSPRHPHHPRPEVCRPMEGCPPPPSGKGPGEIVACRASWRVVFCDGLIQPAAGRATRLESSLLAPARREPPRRPPAHPTPAHPTQAWAMEGAAPDGNRGPNRGRPRRYAPLPPPAAAPGPPFPQSLGNRLPAPRHARPPPPTLAAFRPFHSPDDEVIYTLGSEKKLTALYWILEQ
jgi:hypothetical protein